MRARCAAVAALVAVFVTGSGGTSISHAQAEAVHPLLYSIGGLSEPCSVAVDSVGDIYVGNSRNNKIYVYGPGATHPLITEFRGERPCDLAVDSKGNVYAKEFCCAVEISLGKVVRFSPSAYPPTASTTYSAPVTLQTGEAASGVTAVAVGPQDHVYIDRESRIVELDSADAGNTVLKSNIGSGTLNQSMAVEVSAPTGEIYARNYRGFGGAVIDVFSPGGGSLVDRLGASCTGSEFSEEGRIAVDASTENVFVFDPPAGAIYELDRAADCLGHIGPPFGETTIADSSPSVDVVVDNGMTSPNAGDVYIASGETFGSYASTNELYAYGPAVEGAPPGAVTGTVSDAAPGAVTVTGTVNPNGLGVTGCAFEFIDETTFEREGFASARSAPCSPSAVALGDGTAPAAVSAHVEGLPAAQYRFRLVAQNAVGPSEGAARTFGVPNVDTGGSSSSYREAAIGGTVDPRGLQTRYWVEFGPTESYGESTSPVTLGAGEAGVPIEVHVTGLVPGATYHYRLVAENRWGAVHSADQTMSTLVLPSEQACANASFRVGPSAGLPDCRAYELVTPVYTAGLEPVWAASGPSNGGFDSWLATPTGDDLAFEAEGALPGAGGTGVIDPYEAVRGQTGWTVRPTGPSGQEAQSVHPGGLSPDHSYGFLALNATEGPFAHEEATYLRMSSGQFELLGEGTLGSDPHAAGRWISRGGTHVIFTSQARLEEAAPAAPSLQGTAVGAIYDRPYGGQTKVVSLLPGDLTPPAGSSTLYEGTSADGSAVVFMVGSTMYERREDATTVVVAGGDPRFAGVSRNGGRVFFERDGDPFAFDAESLETTRLAAEGEAAFVNVSADGSHVYFTSSEQLDGGRGTAGEPNLYVWNGTETRFVVTLDPADLQEFEGHDSVNLGAWIQSRSPEANGVVSGPPLDPSRTTPDGRVLVFQSHGDLTGYASHGHSEIFRYDVGDRSLTCVSCSPNGSAPDAGSVLQPLEIEGRPLSGLDHISSVTADGGAVFFDTADPLVPSDVNGTVDVYEWSNGHVSLISSGQGSSFSYLYAMAPDGHDVFISTFDSLVAEDSVERQRSIYDARVDGGFSSPSEQKAFCEGDACQGEAGAAPELTQPLSVGIVAGGNVHSSSRRRHCAALRSARRRRTCRRHRRHRSHRQQGRSIR